MVYQRVFWRHIHSIALVEEHDLTESHHPLAGAVRVVAPPALLHIAPEAVFPLAEHRREGRDAPGRTLHQPFPIEPELSHQLLEPALTKDLPGHDENFFVHVAESDRTMQLHVPELSEFVPAAEGGHNAGVYLLFSRGLIVYVGQTGDLSKRLGEHRREGTKTFDDAQVYLLDDLESRLRVEGVLMLTYLPRYNHALLLGMDGLAGKVWERDHRNIWARKGSRPARPRKVRKAPGCPQEPLGEFGGV